jgi:aminopeptidase N
VFYVTAHEVAHQWWGHMVGWETYHDQWLSEGIADFSASLYLQFTEKNSDKYQKFWESARKRITEKNKFGRRPNDAGPVWMGLRLESYRNDDGYAAVVYNKGAYILQMLRSMMSSAADHDKRFIDMLHEFVQQNLNRNVSTESFQALAEKYMTPALDVERNHRLNWFFGQWVYGTAIPRYKFDPVITPAADGKLVRLGAIRMTGNSTLDDVRMLLPAKPRRVLINANHDVLEM